MLIWGRWGCVVAGATGAVAAAAAGEDHNHAGLVDAAAVGEAAGTAGELGRPTMHK